MSWSQTTVGVWSSLVKVCALVVMGQINHMILFLPAYWRSLQACLAWKQKKFCLCMQFWNLSCANICPVKLDCSKVCRKQIPGGNQRGCSKFVLKRERIFAVFWGFFEAPAQPCMTTSVKCTKISFHLFKIIVLVFLFFSFSPPFFPPEGEKESLVLVLQEH